MNENTQLTVHLGVPSLFPGSMKMVPTDRTDEQKKKKKEEKPFQFNKRGIPKFAGTITPSFR